MSDLFPFWLILVIMIGVGSISLLLTFLFLAGEGWIMTCYIILVISYATYFYIKSATADTYVD